MEFKPFDTSKIDEMRAQYAEIIHEEARRLTRLLDDLLDLSVLENRSVQLSIGVANLHDLLNRAVQSASNTRPERDLRMERNFPAEHLPVFADTDRLVQVFINLISNARKYCDAAQPVLKIAVRQKGGRITVDFIDNGKGIPKESQRIIFEKFARLTDQMRAGGAGLGRHGMATAGEPAAGRLCRAAVRLICLRFRRKGPHKRPFPCG